MGRTGSRGRSGQDTDIIEALRTEGKGGRLPRGSRPEVRTDRKPRAVSGTITALGGDSRSVSVRDGNGVV